MPVNLQLDSKIDAMKNVSGTASGWTDRVEDVIESQFHSSSTMFGRLAIEATPSTGNVPIGAIIPFPGATLPNDYVECDGQALNRADFPALFRLIGTTYGASGSNLFRVPDLRRRTPIGLDAAADLGNVAGAESAIMTEANMPQHSHQLTNSMTIATAGSHTHIYRGGVQSGEQGSGHSDRSGSETGATSGLGKQTSTAGAHSHEIEGQTADAGDSANIGIMAPSMALTYAIRAR